MAYSLLHFNLAIAHQTAQLALTALVALLAMAIIASLQASATALFREILVILSGSMGAPTKRAKTRVVSNSALVVSSPPHFTNIMATYIKETEHPNPSRIALLAVLEKHGAAAPRDSVIRLNAVSILSELL